MEGKVESDRLERRASQSETTTTMAPPPPQESFTFTVGKLGEIYVQHGPKPSLILLILDAGMAVSASLFKERAN